MGKKITKVLTSQVAAGLFLFIFLIPANLFANDSFEAAIDAIEKGDFSRFKALFSNGIDVNKKVDGISPLIYAAMRGQKEIVEFLISKGADVNVKDNIVEVPGGFSGGRTTLHYAVLWGHKEIVGLLMSKGADVSARSVQNETPLMLAIQEGHKEIAELLILKGADIYEKNNYGDTLLMHALLRGRPEIAKLLISKGADVNTENTNGGTPLTIALISGQEEMTRLLVTKGADINHKGRRGETPLLVALSNGQKDVAEFLLSKGAVADLDVRDPEGNTPLMHVAEWGQRDAAELLMSKGAKVNSIDYHGRTPLMFTAMHGARLFALDEKGKLPPQYSTELASRRQIAELLIHSGADVNAKDYDGRTPLIYAAMNGLKEIAALLISKGASVDAVDDQGNTPSMYASRNRDDEIERLIMASSKVSRLAKGTAESHVPVEVDEELQAAKETLINFFDYLHDGQYDKAVLLFEPWEEGTGMHHSSWEGLSSFSLREDRGDKSKVLARYCEAVGTCLRVRILDVKKVDISKYRLKVQFLKDDGEIFALGPCCGEPAETTPQKEFIYFVDRINGVYKVRTQPLYTP
ncbi:MAG: ankyrin repeat domain-containing protein [Thermodesulfovibrionales bacterium]